MKPTTPIEALAAALHADRNSHVTSECDERCATWVMDCREAEGLEAALAELGWIVAPALSLPNRARSGKRETSRKAAASIADLRGGMRGVYELVACHGDRGLTDDEINKQYPAFAERNGFPRIAADSPRKRRQSLTDAGHLRDSGRTRVNPDSGCEQVVWVSYESREVAA